MIEKIQFERSAESHLKGWGRELWIWNGEFCLKLLEMDQGERLSTHYHMEKNEVWYVQHGQIEFVYFDLETSERKFKQLVSDDIVYIPKGQPHGAVILGESLIIEASTHHEDSDSYRIEPGSSQVKGKSQ